MKKGFLLALSLVAASFTSSAATISFTSTVPVTLTSWDSYLGGGTQVAQLAVQQFNSAWGTLNSVAFSLSSTFNGQTTLACFTGSCTFGPVSQSVKVTTYSPLSGNPALVVTNPTQTILAGGKGGTLILNGPSGTQIYNTTGSDSDSIGANSDAAMKTAFTGLGTVAIDVDAIGAISTTVSGGTGNGGGFSSANASFEVTYDYTVPPPPPPPVDEVPEPTTMALAGTALLGLGLMIRRKA
jgi:hypothetical protein